MIEEIKTEFTVDGIKTTLKISDYSLDTNLPYDLATMFEKTIEHLNVNPKIVLEQLNSAFDYNYGEE